mgnify:CR=1 FL=1
MEMEGRKIGHSRTGDSPSRRDVAPLRHLTHPTTCSLGHPTHLTTRGAQGISPATQVTPGAMRGISKNVEENEDGGITRASRPYEVPKDKDNINTRR